MAGVLVFGEVVSGELAAVSLEVASAGTALADALGEPLHGALIGNGAADAAARYCGGFSALTVADDAHFHPYCADAYVAAAQAIIAACAPSVVLFAHTLQTREWVPRLAARLDTGLVTDCTTLAIEDRELVVRKPVYGGGVLGEFVIHGSPRLATVRASVFEAKPRAATGTITRIAVPPPAPGRISHIDESAAAADSGPRLKDAKVIVAGGRGIGGPENWHWIEETAAALGAAVGCSRPVADSGWAPSQHQVGLSGTLVAPELYIAVGISGAVQHLAGISAAKTVVAINTNEEAEIFARADLGVIGDCREVLPAFIKRIKTSGS
jgi:electron transfer flavoprotein alpha subunit